MTEYTDKTTEDFYYNEQLKKCIVQFMAIFSGLKVKTGRNDSVGNGLIHVPIVYGSQDRVVSKIKQGNTQNKPLSLPIISTRLSNFNYEPNSAKGLHQVARHSTMDYGGTFPDDIKSVKQLNPIRWTVEMEVNILASNTDQHFQILEQIAMLFNPTLTLPVNDDYFARNKISEVTIRSGNINENSPAGADRRIINSTIMFDFVARLQPSAEINDNVINKIYQRIVTVTDNYEEFFSSVNGTPDEEDAYDIIINAEDIDFPQE